jgi:8-oxo-dGTP pyrophosphatase MutT (NUDIX family)
MQLQVGVKVLLQNSEGKYLLLHRNTEKYPDISGTWDIVGGRIDIGTPLLENLAREVEEETGLTLTSKPKLIAAQDILLSKKHVVRLTYTASTEGEPVLDTMENDTYEWLTKKELKAHEDLDLYVRELINKKVL